MVKRKRREPLSLRVIVRAAGGLTGAEVGALRERVVELEAELYNCRQIVAGVKGEDSGDA